MRLFIVFLINLSYCYDLVFVVLAYNRPYELEKTLQNLCNLKSDKTYQMNIRIDGPTEGNESLVKESISAAQQFNCSLFNTTVLEHQNKNRGIIGQWVEAWTPMDNQYALIIEDDVELSPDTLYHLDVLIQKFKDDSDLYGIALQRAQWQLGICERKRWRRLDLVSEDEYPPFLKYPAMGTWGQLLFPKPWSKFLAAISRDEDGGVVEVEGLVTEEWAKRGRRLISPVFTRWALSTGYTNMYTNFGSGIVMARSRQPPGTNALETHRKTNDVFPSLLEIKEKLQFVDTVRKMSTCFDPMDLTHSEHISKYGIIVSIPHTMAEIERKSVECSGAVHRIYPMGPTDIFPRLEIYSTRGYFKVNPLEIITRSELLNVEYRAADNYTVMKLIRDHGPVKIHMLAEEDYEFWPTLSTEGICTRFYCPFVPGLYPDKQTGHKETELKFDDL